MSCCDNTTTTLAETVTDQEVFAKPAYESTKTDTGFVLKVSVPGVAKADADVTVDNGLLTVTALRKSTVPEDWKLLHSELASPNYRLRLRLNDEIDAEKMTAKVEGGVLTIDLPVREEAKPRVIEIA